MTERDFLKLSISDEVHIDVNSGYGYLGNAHRRPLLDISIVFRFVSPSLYPGRAPPRRRHMTTTECGHQLVQGSHNTKEVVAAAGGLFNIQRAVKLRLLGPGFTTSPWNS